MVQTVDRLRHVFLVSVFHLQIILFLSFLDLHHNEIFEGAIIIIDVDGIVTHC